MIKAIRCKKCNDTLSVIRGKPLRYCSCLSVAPDCCGIEPRIVGEKNAIRLDEYGNEVKA